MLFVAAWGDIGQEASDGRRLSSAAGFKLCGNRRRATN
jgi:hypothetical protein